VNATEEIVMNLSNWCKCGVTVLGGLALMLSGLVATVATTPDEVSSPATSFDEKAERQQYHLYVGGWTRVGPLWNYVGSFDANEDANAAVQALGHPYFQIVAGSQLELPRVEERDEHYNFDYVVIEANAGLNPYVSPSRYRTREAAAAAAEQIRAEGKRFEVLYRLYGGQTPDVGEKPAKANEPAAKAKKEAAEKALSQYHVYGRVGCKFPRVRLLGSYDRAEAAFKVAEERKSDGVTELTVVTGTSGELPPAGRPCTFEVYSVNRKCGQYSLAGAYATLPEAVEQALKIQKNENYQGFGIAYNYSNKTK
jgi:hypothetical protein